MTPSWAIGCAAAALLALAAAAPAAEAQNCVAEPVERWVSDPAGDDHAAPDIIAVELSIARDCNVRVGVNLGDHGQTFGVLGERELIFVYLDTDGSADTGNDGFDAVLVQAAPNERHLGVWNGDEFRFSEAPGEPYFWGGVTAPAARLGIKASATIGVWAVAAFDTGGNGMVVDAAPEQGMLRVPVRFAEAVPSPTPASPPAPPALPAPTPPAPTVAPAPGSPVVTRTTHPCRVPAVRGMTVKLASARMRKAGCQFRTRRVASRRVRPGRVVSTSPRATTMTPGTVELRIARRPGARR